MKVLAKLIGVAIKQCVVDMECLIALVTITVALIIEITA